MSRPDAELIERMARAIALAVSGASSANLDALVIPSWPPMPTLRCGFTLVPAPGEARPLWEWYLPAANEAFEVVAKDLEVFVAARLAEKKSDAA